jgi:hypothetical protein
MKKQLFSLHDEVVQALDDYKKATGHDKSAFVDALIASRLGVTLPASAVERHAAIGDATDLSVVATPPTEATEEAAPVSVAPASVPGLLAETPDLPKFEEEAPAATGFVVEKPLISPPVETPEPVAPAPLPSTDMPIVEPVQSMPPQPEPPKDSSVRVCPNGHGEYDTPFCLDCLI